MKYIIYIQVCQEQASSAAGPLCNFRCSLWQWQCSGSAVSDADTWCCQIRGSPPAACSSEDRCSASAIRPSCVNLCFASTSSWNKLSLVPACWDFKYQAACFGLALDWKMIQPQDLWDFCDILFVKGAACLSERCNFQWGIIQFSVA